MSALGLAAALLTIFGAGFGATALLPRSARPIAADELAALSWLLGTFVVSIILWLLGFAMRGIALQLSVTTICLLLAGAGTLRMRAGAITFRSGWPENLIERLLFGLLWLECGAAFYLSLTYSLGWDGLLIWEFKARCAFLNGGVIPASYFSDLARLHTHLEYPLSLPLTYAWIYLWLGECDQFWIKVIPPIFYCAGMLMLARAAAELTRVRSLGLLVAILFFYVPFIRGTAAAIGGYADVPLSFLYLTAVYFLLLFLRDNSERSLVAFVVIAAALPWMKREGAMLWLIVAGCGAWIVWWRRGVRLALVSLLPGICIIAAWRLFLWRMHAPAPTDFVPVSLAVFALHLDRLLAAGEALLQTMLWTDRWSWFWYVAIGGFICTAWRQRSGQTLVLLICFVAPIAAYCATYVFSTWPEYLRHVHTSLPRLLLHVIPLAWLAVAYALKPREPRSL